MKTLRLLALVLVALFVMAAPLLAATDDTPRLTLAGAGLGAGPRRRLDDHRRRLWLR